MHRVTVNITSITWDEEQDYNPEDYPRHLRAPVRTIQLPSEIDTLTVTVDDASDDEQILGAILDMLTDEYDFLIKDVQYVITEMTRVEG
jgi:hypothetical protein